MMEQVSDVRVSNGKPRKRLGLRIFGGLVVALLLFGGLTAGWVKYNVYASPLDPTTLSATEQAALDEKMVRLERASMTGAPGSLQPEAYSEADARRELRITERELNSLIAKNPKLAERVAVDLSQDLLSLTVLVPVNKDVPLAGGTTARITTGATMRYEAGQPVIALRGISIGGVPLPAAWLGGIKNKDLLDEFGGKGGFWDQFAAGVDDIQVREGCLYLKLKE
jgi:hypothetical protein